MSDALGKLIRLSNRHNLPVIVHDSVSGESAVLMNLDEYEIMAELREECEGYEEYGFDEESEENDEDFEADFDEDGENSYQNTKGDQSQFWKESFASAFDQAPQGQRPDSFPGNNTFFGEESAPATEDWSVSPNFDPNWEMPMPVQPSKPPFLENVDELKYEPSEKSLFPAFAPQEDDDDEPIFFEEPV